MLSIYIIKFKIQLFHSILLFFLSIEILSSILFAIEFFHFIVRLSNIKKTCSIAIAIEHSFYEYRFPTLVISICLVDRSLLYNYIPVEDEQISNYKQMRRRFSFFFFFLLVSRFIMVFVCFVFLDFQPKQVRLCFVIITPLLDVFRNAILPGLDINSLDITTCWTARFPNPFRWAS
jgi:hypothetical protein